MAIEIKDKTCNGWVLVNPTRLTCTTAKNIHLAEVAISDLGNIIRWSASTYCEEDIKAEKKYIEGCIFRNTGDGERTLRNKIAEFQNSGYEVCGTCAGHLYADCVA